MIENKEPYIKTDANDYYYLFSLLDYGDIPILFLAADDSNNMFLCDCTETRNIQRWIIGKTNIDIVWQVIDKQLTVFNALKKLDKYVNIIEYNFLTNSFSEKLNCDIDCLEANFIPDKDAYLVFPNEDCRENIEVLINKQNQENSEENI